MANKIQPVLRYAGSKYRKIDQIIETLGVNANSKFLDMFGGSGIVGVNVKHLIGAETTINDFDNMFPINDSTAIKNMLTFDGNGKNFTKSALIYFNRRIKHGYWDKLKTYNSILNNCIITKAPFVMLGVSGYTHIYVDPPYDDIKGLYKKDFTREDHIKLKVKLDAIKSDSKILISYNDTPFIRELYKDWNISTEEFQYQCGLSSDDKPKKAVHELWITNIPKKKN